jgi:membrane-associated protein
VSAALVQLAGIVDTLVHWLQPAFRGTTGYAIIAAAVLLERSLFVGLVVPGDVILALGGVYAAQGDLSIVTVIAIGAGAAICGESAGFWLGRRYGMGLIEHLPFGDRLAKRFRTAEGYFQKRGAGWTVAIGRFATAAGAFVPFTAGLGKMPYRRFLLYDVPAILVWATAIGAFGYVFGRNLDLLEKVLSRFGYGALALLALYLGGRWLWRRYRDPKSRVRASRR